MRYESIKRSVEYCQTQMLTLLAMLETTKSLPFRTVGGLLGTVVDGVVVPVFLP